MFHVTICSANVDTLSLLNINSDIIRVFVINCILLCISHNVLVLSFIFLYYHCNNLRIRNTCKSFVHFVQ